MRFVCNSSGSICALAFHQPDFLETLSCFLPAYDHDAWTFDPISTYFRYQSQASTTTEKLAGIFHLYQDIEEQIISLCSCCGCNVMMYGTLPIG